MLGEPGGDQDQIQILLLESHELLASSWTDTEQYRGEIRHGAEKILKQLTSNHN
jgi:hypothetical protein